MIALLLLLWHFCTKSLEAEWLHSRYIHNCLVLIDVWKGWTILFILENQPQLRLHLIVVNHCFDLPALGVTTWLLNFIVGLVVNVVFYHYATCVVLRLRVDLLIIGANVEISDQFHNWASLVDCRWSRLNRQRLYQLLPLNFSLFLMLLLHQHSMFTYILFPLLNSFFIARLRILWLDLIVDKLPVIWVLLQ